MLSCTLVLASCGGGGGRNTHYGPRIVPLGQPVPKGGGTAKLGSPYTMNGRYYVPQPFNTSYDKHGIASWYGEDFHGRRTANGEIYDMEALTAAHTTLPIPSYVRVTNTRNGRSMLVRVNDRGPYVDDRIIDLSWAVASLLQIEGAGTGPVHVQYLGPAPIDGNDRRERQFLAQQPWAGPQVASAASPAKAMRSLASGGGMMTSSNETTVPLEREKIFHDRLNGEQQWPTASNAPVEQPQQTYVVATRQAPQQAQQNTAIADATVFRGGAPRSGPKLLSTPFTQPAQPQAQQPQPVKLAAKPQSQPKATQPRPVAQRPQPSSTGTATARAKPSSPPIRPAVVSVSSAVMNDVHTATTTPPKEAAPTHIGSAFRQTASATQSPGTKIANATPPAAARQAPQRVQVPKGQPAPLFIEAGVFRERALADKLAAILTEIAPTNIELTTSGTEIVHRLRVGPFANNEVAQTAITRIRAAGLTKAHIVTPHGT